MGLLAGGGALLAKVGGVKSIGAGLVLLVAGVVGGWIGTARTHEPRLDELESQQETNAEAISRNGLAIFAMQGTDLTLAKNDEAATRERHIMIVLLCEHVRRGGISPNVRDFVRDECRNVRLLEGIKP